MSNRLTKEETRLIVELSGREIKDLCARIDTDRESYAGHSQHDLAEERLARAVSARDKLAARLPDRVTPLYILKEDYKPRFRDKLLGEKFKG